MPVDHQTAVAGAWNSRIGPAKIKNKFWLFPAITGHINNKLIGREIPGITSGFNRKIQAAGPFDRAVSIGCGLAGKELSILKAECVRHFDLFELADERMAKAKESYSVAGLADRATFNVGDAFAHARAEEYDLVYWNMSLHHMPSARQAIEWSWNALKPGGVIAMLEFVGPTRFQWTERNLTFMNRFLSAIPDRFFAVPGRPGISAGRQVKRSSIKEMVDHDPSEAADSGAIIPSLQTFFPQADIQMLGGAIYHFGLKPILPNIDEQPDGAAFLNSALLLDDALSVMGENHFAYCLARKT
jgi:SAM-dependent methyltransferase